MPDRASNLHSALLLVGGLGTRLRSLHPDRPKALVPVCGRPFLSWQIEQLHRQGVNTVHLAAGYRGESLADWVKTNPVPGVTLTVSVEPTPLGTGGGLRFALPHMPLRPLLVLNGDTLAAGLDVQALEKRHQSPSNPWITMAIAPIEEAGRYGSVELDADDRITAFLEKTERARGWINAGVYVFSTKALARLPSAGVFSLEQDLFPALAREGRIQGCRINPPLLDMGTPDGLAQTEAWIKRT